MKQMITIYPNKTLFERIERIPIKDIKSDTFTQIASSMFEILKDKGGVGLSANQVNLPLDICVVNITQPLIFINPRTLKSSKTMINSREGCLSLPGVIVTVSRHKDLTVEYETVDGVTETVEATGMLAVVLQHEMDHLNGILMINRLNEFHKSKALKALHKYKRNPRL